MVQLNQAFQYKISYEIGGLRGWFMNVDDYYRTDYVDQNTRKVVLHRTAYVHWKISYNSSGLALVSVANGPYKDWYLTGYKDIATITRQIWKNSYWDLSLTAKRCFDHSKLSFRNSSDNLYMRGWGKYKRDQHSYVVYIHKNKIDGGNEVSFRVQAVAGSTVIENGILNSESEVNRLSNLVVTEERQANYYINRYNELSLQYSSFENRMTNWISELTNTNTALKEKHSALENSQLIKSLPTNQAKHESLKMQFEEFKRKCTSKEEESQRICRTIKENQQTTQKELVLLTQQMKGIKDSISKRQNQIEKGQFNEMYLEPLKTGLDDLKYKIYEKLTKLKLRQTQAAEMVVRFAETVNRAQLIKFDQDPISNQQYFQLLDQKQKQYKQLWQRYKQRSELLVSMYEEERLRNEERFRKNHHLQTYLNAQSMQISRLSEIVREYQQQKLYLEQKTCYFKQLYKQELKPKLQNLISRIISSNKQRQSEIFHLKDHIEKLTEVLRFYQQVQQKPQEEEVEEPQSQQKYNQQQNQEKGSQNQQENTNSSVNDRVQFKLFHNKELLADQKTSAGDKAEEYFEKYAIQKYMLRVESDWKEASMKNIRQYSAFDPIFSHNSLVLEQFTAKQFNSSPQMESLKKLAIIKKKLCSNITSIDIQIEELSQWCAIGVYQAEGLIETCPQTIGTFQPMKHQYALLESNGRFIIRGKQEAHREASLLKLKKGMKIRVICNAKLYFVSFQILQESEEVQEEKTKLTTKMTKYLIYFDYQKYRFGIAFKGKQAKFKIIEYKMEEDCNTENHDEN